MPTTRRFWLTCLLATAFMLAAAAGQAAAESNDVLVFAAASLKNALDEIASQWQRHTGKKAVMSYAASNTLIKQIEQGAPANIFILADLDWMDYGQTRKLIKPQTRSNLLGNQLVLVAPKESDVRAEALGAWNGIRDKVAQAESVRAALLLVSRGEASLGIVYQTDAASDPAVTIVGTFPEHTHPPIIYPIAPTEDSNNADALAFFNYIRSPSARAAFERQGFTLLGPGAQRS